MKTFGIRHIALNVVNPQKTKDFYTNVLGMTVEWEPDPDNIYLTNGGLDNLAIHKCEAIGSNSQRLDHIGFFVPTKEEVETWYQHVQKHGAKIVKELKDHRDGARSFYMEDPDGAVIQVLYHEPVTIKATGSEIQVCAQ